jgi:hypothetical protein
MYGHDSARKAGVCGETLVPMKPNFTDQYRYLRGYVRAEFHRHLENLGRGAHVASARTTSGPEQRASAELHQRDQTATWRRQ